MSSRLNTNVNSGANLTKTPQLKLRPMQRSTRVGLFLVTVFYGVVIFFLIVSVYQKLAHASIEPATEATLAVDKNKYSKSEINVLSEISKTLTAIQTPSGWDEFVKNNPSIFPAIENSHGQNARGQNASGQKVSVEKKEIEIDGETFTLGVGYRQVFIKAPLDRVAGILRDTSLYQPLYGLDRPAVIPGTEIDLASSVYEAHIFKKVPVLSDQDYILKYETKNGGNQRFIRAQLKEDLKKFALRDNLTVLSATEGGTILREVSYVYILKWYLRMLGPQVRSVMTKELTKLSESVRCLAETEGAYDSQDKARACWKQAEKI